MKLSCIKFLMCFILYLLEWTLGVYYLPQSTGFTYFNEKYAYNCSAFITRFGRKSPYYYNIEAGIYHTWGNNITGIYYLPQRTGFTYFNEKYAHNCSAFITRFGRKSPYYYNIEAGIYHTWGNNITGIYYLPQRTGFTYFNEKYAHNCSAFITRFGRKSPYYYNIEAGIYHTWGNNITLHLVFYESQLNQYKRSFFEIQLKLCDLLERDPYFGKAMNLVLSKRGITCPMPPGMYKVHNMTFPSVPNVLAISKGKVEVTFRQLQTNEHISSISVTFVTKEK